MREPFELREATTADIPRLCSLLAQLFEQEVEFEPDSDRQRKALELLLSARVRGIGVESLGTILVAEVLDHSLPKLVGMVSILYSVSTALGGYAAWIEDMVVDGVWRGRGIGGGLLDAAIVHARAAGCLRLSLLTDSANLPGQSLYRSRGFEASSMLPYRKLLSGELLTE